MTARASSVGIVVIALLACVACVAGCGGAVARVPVPADPSHDAAPVITVTAVPLVPQGPGAAGDVEPGKADVSQTTSVNVTRGARITLLAKATNAGGVQQLALSAQQRGVVAFQATATDAKDAQGHGVNALFVRAPDGNPGGTLELAIDEPATVHVMATNFNGQSTVIDVTYVPADLTVTITADPPVVGYTHPVSSRLAWSVLYGVEVSKITGNVLEGASDVPARGTATVSPRHTTTYTVTATDRSGTKSQSVMVRYEPPPPPPEPKLTASPTEGYVCLGTEVKLEWTVGKCDASCVVSLRGTGRGYAQGKDYQLDRLPRTGSFAFKPGDQTDFVLTASAWNGSRTAEKIVRIAPPSDSCGGGGGSGQSPMLKVFYLLVKPTDPTVQACTTHMVWFDTEANALAAMRAVWGPAYVVSAIDASQFQTACQQR